MDFTDEERRAWHAARRNDNAESDDWTDGEAGDTCLHCGCPVGSGNGVVTQDAAICDVCSG